MSKLRSKVVRAFVFDLDGTLIDSRMDLVNSVNAMLRETGRRDLATDVVASYIGHGAPQLIASALGPGTTEEDQREGLTIFLKHYDRNKLEETRAYPGVEEGLLALRGTPMAVLTNKPAELSVKILKGLRLAHYFRAVYGGDSFEKKKPDPSGALAIVKELGVLAGETAMVGDSDVDIQTARNAGMVSVGVTYGFGQHDARVHTADVYVDRMEELTSLTCQGQRSKTMDAK